MNSTTTAIPSSSAFAELFASNMFTFDDVNSPVFQQHMMNEELFNAMQETQNNNQEILLSNIMNPEETPITPNTTSSSHNFTDDASRDWRIINVNSSDLAQLVNEDTVKIAIKTRDDKAANFQVPDKLYSSLRYVLSQRLDSIVLQNKHAVLMSKIQVVNPQTHEEIRKKNNEFVIDKGNTMVELKYNADTKCYECTEKIKFLDNSYRHNDIKFAFKVSFYDASQPAFLTRSPILEVLSAPFHVRARRPPKSKRDEEDVLPVKEKKVNKKRRISEIESEPSDEIEDIKKVPKVILNTKSSVVPSPASSKRIISLMDNLLVEIFSLPESEREEALEAARKKFNAYPSLRQPIPMELLNSVTNFPISSALNPSNDVDLNTYSSDDLLSFEKFL